jgi:Mrp family chromosome partitioning ATPase
MNLTPERPWDADSNMSPVILPIGATSDSGWETPVVPAASGSLQVRKFSFPAIGDASSEYQQCVAWPKYDCTEAVRAGTRLAVTILGRLPSDRPSVIGITSPCDGDGKTTLVEVLAPELAKRCSGGALVVDADFRKSGLTARLTIPVRKNAATTLIYPTDLAGLNVLPMSQQRQSRSADARWIEGLRERWPLTLLDMASMAHRDTAPLLRHCDGVCLVVRLGHTPRRAVQEAARIISIYGGPFLGCIVVGNAA